MSNMLLLNDESRKAVENSHCHGKRICNMDREELLRVIHTLMRQSDWQRQEARDAHQRASDMAKRRSRWWQS